MTMTAHRRDRRTRHELDEVISSLRVGMFRYAIVFAVIAVIAMTFTGAHIAAPAVAVAKLVFFISLIICALLLTFTMIVENRSR